MTAKESPILSSPWEIFGVFFRLGWVCFGGPVAHLGYFRTEFVERRKWLGDDDYADLVALCQFLPGPASSQVGYAIGLRRGGFWGGLAAWLGFTLPSAALMIGFALGLGSLGSLNEAGWVVGLKLVAVAVVAHALWGMAVKLCPDLLRVVLAVLVMVALLLQPGPLVQVAVIVAGGFIGLGWYRSRVQVTAVEVAPAKRHGWPWLLLFGFGLLGLPLWAASGGEVVAVFDGFYRAGSLVFGGGHVVLPLLDAFTVGQGWIETDTFLAGYGAAQALPGPLFAFTAFLGASIETGPGGVAGGLLALVAVYVPSLLLILGALPYWDQLRTRPTAQAALMGTNAAVVGLLAAALVHPIGSVSLTSPLRVGFALVALALLKFTRCPPWLLVLGGAGLGQVLGSWLV